MTTPLDPRRAGEWWEWECDRCGAHHESHEAPLDGDGCLWCDTTATEGGE